MQPRKDDETSLADDAPGRADRLARRIRAAEAGDHRAVRTLLGDVAPAVVRVVAFVLGPRHPDSADLVQDSLTEFLRALPPTAGVEAADLERLASWIALRRALEAAQWPALPAPGKPGRRWWGRPGAERVRQRRRRLVAGSMMAVSEEEAEVLGLRLLVRLTVAEIAELTDLSPSEVRSLLRSAKVTLGASAAPMADAAPLHPEALRDLQNAGRLSADEAAALAAHEAHCPSCALERDVAADLTVPRRRGDGGVHLGQAVDGATAHWVWTVCRRVLVSRRQRRWTWAALGALVTLSVLLGGALWTRMHAPPPDLALPADLADPPPEL
jgi:DNA-directed RNA polymerase specialized sigma24 family protein